MCRSVQVKRSWTCSTGPVPRVSPPQYVGLGKPVNATSRPASAAASCPTSMNARRMLSSRIALDVCPDRLERLGEAPLDLCARRQLLHRETQVIPHGEGEVGFLPKARAEIAADHDPIPGIRLRVSLEVLRDVTAFRKVQCVLVRPESRPLGAPETHAALHACTALMRRQRDGAGDLSVGRRAR